MPTGTSTGITTRTTQAPVPSWGYQPGHQTEWAKLLLILERHRPAEWLLPTARHLFDTAMHRAWDAELGGIFYGFAPDHSICDGDKYFWVQAESFAAAALLAARTREERYWGWYDRIWAYSLAAHGRPPVPAPGSGSSTSATRRGDDEKSPAGKTDYHTMGPAMKLSMS